MSRRHAAEKRDIIPDPKFGNVVVSKFMNAIMYDGKKSVAEGIVYGALEMIEGKTKQNPLNVFQQALDNVMPSIEVRSRRVGGATYQVPVEVRTSRRQALGIRWIIAAARERNERTMHPIIGETQSRSAKTRTRWRKPTVPSRIIAGNSRKVRGLTPYAPQPPHRGLPQLRHHGAHRCREDDDD